jgi:hypothetical protein
MNGFGVRMGSADTVDYMILKDAFQALELFPRVFPKVLFAFTSVLILANNSNGIKMYS